MIDPNLIKSCQQGDETAFEELYKVHATKALRTVYLLVSNRDIAEDILQEAFFECYRDINKLRSPEAFETWFYRILVRISWRLAAKERKAIHENLDDHVEYLKEDKIAFESMENDPQTSMIREIVNHLSIPLRTTIILYYYNDMSIKEISKVMNCLQGTVKSRLHNGRKFLGKEIKNKQDSFLTECITRDFVKGESHL